MDSSEEMLSCRPIFKSKVHHRPTKSLGTPIKMNPWAQPILIYGLASPSGHNLKMGGGQDLAHSQGPLGRFQALGRLVACAPARHWTPAQQMAFSGAGMLAGVAPSLDFGQARLFPDPRQL
ncbi:hypothetical protein PGT21_009257 [Puccinia graminis f. sp. tritici]|uniref:Uncharacterized protein n=1 Tax=Puccinia graminis f. sp. tritici TaxID=56615 RepID=A0A5B0QHY0_PUCGR|nr:hypothetical protein PGT21_009257 [Puccinia graminis f. sp. tritici]